MGTNWSKEEAYATVEDYFSMLSAEMKGIAYSKTEHRKKLIHRVEGRSDSAVEKKHQNISAILLRFGLPYIDGYKPLRNYQVILENLVQDYLSKNAEAAEDLLAFAEKPVSVPAIQMPISRSVLVKPPLMKQRRSKSSPKPRSLLPPQFDFAEREANNRSLGRQREGFAAKFEEDRLKLEGRSDLAERIEWTSETKGHGGGYDILSFESSGEYRYIEVKTTNCGREFPFFASRNEVEFSRGCSGFFLYRVFNFSKDPKLFILKGSLEDHCILTAENYRASFI